MSKRRRSENMKDETRLENEDTQLQKEEWNNQDVNNQPKMKPEEAAGSEKVNIQEFRLRIGCAETKFTIQCDRPQTVLQAITSKPGIKEKIKCDEDKIVLQVGTTVFGTAIATHFPCTLLKKNELVTLTKSKQTVEVRDQERDYSVDLNEHCYVVNIETKGVTNTLSKKLFKNCTMKKFTELCVYGTENMTLRDAIERDGRFQDFEDFKLEDFTKGKVRVFSSDKIQHHHGNTLRIRLDKYIPKKDSEASLKDRAGPSSAGPSPKVEWVPVSELLKTKRAGGISEDAEEIYQRLRDQFAELKQELLERNSVEALKKRLKEVDFGKSQYLFSDVGQTKEILKMAEAVCKIQVGTCCTGSGFVLFNRYILTNAHLFDGVIYNNNVRPDIDIAAIFHYETGKKNITKLKVSNTFVDYDKQMDYAVLEVNVEDEGKVPPGLMKYCCPRPDSGEVYVVGHPKGGPKMFDPTCIIEKKERLNKASDSLEQFKDNDWAFISVVNHLQKQGIDKILYSADNRYHEESIYNKFMYHGSSGSPVFDTNCKVFGMHTGGFTYDFPTKGSVIEYARPLLLILQTFVSKLRNRNNILLQAVEKELEDCPYRLEILTGEEPMVQSSL